MSGCYSYAWMFFFTVVAKQVLGVTVQTGLYSRVELIGEQLDQQTCDSIKEVEWTILNKKCLCLKIFIINGTTKSFSHCCGNAHFSLRNNSLILENVTAQVEGNISETMITKNGSTKSFNFTLKIVYPPKAIGISISWSSNNTSVSLTCEVNGSFTNIIWKREDSPILKDNRNSFSENNQTLHISNISNSDYRKYSCEATNAYGKSQTQTYITSDELSKHGENTTQAHDSKQTIRIFILSGFTIGILALCIILFCAGKKYSHGQCHRRTHKKPRGHRGETDRTTQGGLDTGLETYQEIPGTADVSLLPYVYTDFIKPQQAHQNAPAAENAEDFGYSEIGPAVQRTEDDLSTTGPNTWKE